MESSSSDNLIESLRQSQESLLASLELVSDHARSFSRCKPFLAELEDKVLAHFQLLTQKIIPCLEGFLIRSHKEKQLQFQWAELKEIKLTAFDFFEQYLHSNCDSVAVRNFPILFSQFRKIFLERISLEEEYLRPLLDDFYPGKET